LPHLNRAVARPSIGYRTVNFNYTASARCHLDASGENPSDAVLGRPVGANPTRVAEKRFAIDPALEGSGFEPLVPSRKRRPWREAPWPTIVVSREDLCLMTPSSLSVRDLPSATAATAERPFARPDRWFESTSLRCRVANFDRAPMVRRDPRAETGLFGGAAILMRMGKHRSATVTPTTLQRWALPFCYRGGSSRLRLTPPPGRSGSPPATFRLRACKGRASFPARRAHPCPFCGS
jgi:hypothetical protein